MKAHTHELVQCTGTPTLASVRKACQRFARTGLAANTLCIRAVTVDVEQIAAQLQLSVTSAHVGPGVWAVTYEEPAS